MNTYKFQKIVFMVLFIFQEAEIEPYQDGALCDLDNGCQPYIYCHK